MTARSIEQHDPPRGVDRADRGGRRRLVGVAVVATSVLAACGEADPGTSGTAGTAPSSDPRPPATAPASIGPSGTTEPVGPATTDVPDGNEGGFGDPVWTEGDFTDDVATRARRLTGTIRVATNGCWQIELGGERAVLAVPEGFATAHDDAGRLVGPDGLVLADGTQIDGTGDLVWSDRIVGGPDSSWGTIAGYCAPPSAPGAPIAAFARLQPAYDPTGAPVEQLVASLRDADLDTTWPCGYGFAASTADERIGLYLYAQGAPTSGTVTLPDPAWSATVQVGKDLFVQHCDDVVEATEPPVVVVGTWPLVAGTFGVTAPSDEGGCGGTAVRARLIGAAVETPLGRVELPPLDLVNSAWGCFAG